MSLTLCPMILWFPSIWSSKNSRMLVISLRWCLIKLATKTFYQTVWLDHPFRIPTAIRKQWSGWVSKKGGTTQHAICRLTDILVWERGKLNQKVWMRVGERQEHPSLEKVILNTRRATIYPRHLWITLRSKKLRLRTGLRTWMKLLW